MTNKGNSWDIDLMHKVWTVLGWVVFGVAGVLFVVGLCAHYLDGLNTDLSADLLLAKVLAEGKGFIISDQWYYSTELHFIHNQLVFVPLFWLTNNWQVVQIVGTVILNGLMLLAFYFLLRSLRQQRCFPVLGTLLILPVSFEYAHFVNYATAYTTYITLAMVVIGLVIFALRATTKQKFYWLTAGAGIVSLLMAVGGNRSLVTLCAPLLCTAVLFWLTYRQTKLKNVGKKMFWLSLIVLGAGLVGWAINILLGQWLHFDPFYKKSHLIFGRNAFTLKEWWSRVISIVRIFGFETGDNGSALPVRIILNVGAVGLMVLYVVGTIAILCQHKKYPAGVVILTMFNGFGLGILFCSIALTDIEYYVRFYLPVSVFVVPVCGLFLANCSWWRQRAKQIGCGLVYAGALIMTVLNFIEFYFCARWVWCRTNGAELTQIAEQLTAEGYTSGYASFYSYNVLAQVSNGQLEMYGYRNLYYDDFDHLYPWLQLTDHLQTRPTGKVFFLVGVGEDQLYIPQVLAGVADHPPIYASAKYYVYGYDSVQELLTLTDIYHSKP